MANNIVPKYERGQTRSSANQMNLRTLFPVKEILKSHGYEIEKCSDGQNYLEDLLIKHILIGDENYETLLQYFNEAKCRIQVRNFILGKGNPDRPDAKWIVNHSNFENDDNTFTKTFEWYVGEIMVRFFEGFSFAYGVEVRDVMHNQTETSAGDYDTLVVMRDLRLVYFECKTGGFDCISIQKAVDRAIALNCEFVVIMAFSLREEVLIEEIKKASHPILNNSVELNRIQIASRSENKIYEWHNCYFISASKDFIEQMKIALRINEAKRNYYTNRFRPLSADRTIFRKMGYTAERVNPPEIR